MISKDSGTLELILGILAGFTLALLLGALVGENFSVPELLRSYQTLLAGVLALIGAWLTIVAISKQIRQAEVLFGLGRDKRRQAVRAVLPMTLSKLGQYGQECVEQLLRVFPEDYDGDPEASVEISDGLELRVPEIPDDVLKNLSLNIEFGTEAASLVLSELLSHLQIQHGRLSDTISHLNSRDVNMSVSRSNIESDILDALEVYARCSLLFEYARAKNDHPTAVVDAARMSNAAFLSSMLPESYGNPPDFGGSLA